jgi:hypothetical protein
VDLLYEAAMQAALPGDASDSGELQLAEFSPPLDPAEPTPKLGPESAQAMR